MNFINFISNFDYSVARSVNNFLHFTNGVLTPLLKLITFLGNGGVIFICISVFMLIFKKTRKIGAISLLSLLLGFIITNLLLKNIIAIQRPFVDEKSNYYLWWTQAGSIFESGFSFPSGHTTSAMTFGFTLFLCLKKRTSWLYLIIPLIMGFTRIYFMVHYASDVIGGLIVGSLCSTVSFLIVKNTM